MRINANPKDNDMLLRFQSGDAVGLEYFIKKHQREMLFFAKSILNNLEVAEEIVDDSFLKTWNQREKLNSASELKSYLYVVVRHACLDYLKSPKNRPSDKSINDELLILAPETIESHLIYTELLNAIYEEVCKLPEKQKQVFLLSYFDGLTTDEIMERLSISANAVFIHKHEATKAIRALFKKTNPFFYLLLFASFH
ncbi:MAG: sigma-70 family RNA polymerase sigma factor [Sphingobacterium sp.]|jgi:RNA polymerase sigma-70 factor (ECF subfamily)|nr:sigma-70 family RNA polymerase sigma factor [Sphingobacterium sp.]